MSLRRVALVAVVAAAALVPATAASGSHHGVKIRLALVPLQTAQLGPAGASLALDYGSGPHSAQYVDSGLKAFDVRQLIGDGADFEELGRIHDYSLDYGDPFTGSTGVMEIRSAVEEYTTPAAAKKGLALWQHVDSSLQTANPGTEKKVKAEQVGQRHFAYLHTWAAPNLNPIVSLDEQVLAGRFILDLTVTAGSASAAEHVAPHLVHVLHRRLQRMLEGHLSGTPAKLPRTPSAGQAPGGPDLSTMILQASDLGQSDPADGIVQHYVGFQPALSAYVLFLFMNAGSYDLVEQLIGWWPTATEATYAEAYVSALFAKEYGVGSAVDLSAVGDNATGSIVDRGNDGVYVLVTLTNDQAGEFVFAQGKSTVEGSDVQSLAQAAADRLDAGLGP